MVSVGHCRRTDLHDGEEFETLQYHGHSHWLDYHANTARFDDHDDHIWLLVTLVEAPSTYLGRIVCRMSKYYRSSLCSALNEDGDILDSTNRSMSGVTRYQTFMRIRDRARPSDYRASHVTNQR
ncbi:uncharacterized protein ARMOST_02168 [Armillaria ostoyae]|uniref:Uncharacterized protein n=1 Tax=Armillaria ostoyae TaxID=47428 RepID=A0A284QR34_ARMOS|nr:uncharacterized protein ARMOST_02168 [Armillaria ostoyae]